MNLTNQPTYQARHPKSVLVTPEFPHCAAALNALFARDMWERDEDINDMIGDEVDLTEDAALKGFKAGRPEQTSGQLRWRAPTETLRGPCSLWKETQEVKPDAESINASRAYGGMPPLPADHPELQPKTYTAYKLVCELDRLIDSDFQTITRIADRHNASYGVEAVGDKVLLQLAFVR